MMIMDSFMSARITATRAPDGDAHQAYMVYDKNDLRWARRLKFHLRRFQALET
jgi:hypothetical protein